MSESIRRPPRGTILRVKLDGDSFRRWCVLLTDFSALEYDYGWHMGVMILGTTLPDDDKHPRVNSTPRNGLPTQHTYRARVESPLAIPGGSVLEMGESPIEPQDMARIDVLLKLLYGP